MYYYLLCYGRTAFTKHTVNSIIASAKRKPEIILINNGWFAGAVPPEVIGLWDLFVTEFLIQGKISKVINLNNSSHLVLDAYEIAENECPDEFYFISDNDCIIDAVGFDEVLLSAMIKYNLNKLGIDFFRNVSLQHCNQFPIIQNDLNVYYTKAGAGNLVASGSESTYCQSLGIEEREIFPGSKITNNATDTTLSIVRKGNAVNQGGANRISPSIKDLKMLHIGYLEGIFNSDNSLEVVEMLIYAGNRFSNMAESKADYLSRFLAYSNLIQRENIDVYNYYRYLTRNQ